MLEKPCDQQRDSGSAAQNASDHRVASRRGVMKDYAKLALALGATVLSGQMAKAAPKPPCFLRGTKIRAVTGEVAVEDIVVGDLLVTASGAACPVSWVGCWQARKSATEQWPADMRPILIKRSAFAPNLPYTDLYVSVGHGILADGVLIPAGELVNGSSIVVCDAAERQQLDYFHIKLEKHDVIFASGLAAETLLKVPAIAGAVDTDAFGEELHCLPVLGKGSRSRLLLRARRLADPLFGPQKLDRIRQELRARSASIG